MNLNVHFLVMPQIMQLCNKQLSSDGSVSVSTNVDEYKTCNTFSFWVLEVF